MADVGAERRSAAADLMAGIVLFGVSAIGTWSLSHNRFITTEGYGNDPGPGMLPGLLLLLLGLSSLAMMVLAGKKLRRLRRADINKRPIASARNPLLMPALLVVTLLAYAHGMTELGFLETTASFALFWTIAIGMQDSGRPDARRLAVWVVQGAAICAGIYAIFAWLIKIPLP